MTAYTKHLGPAPVLLTESARAVFRELVRVGPSTRPLIGQTLGLSRPTMSAAIAELERLGYAEVAGEVQGPLGRKALEYRVGTAAGHVIAVDAGSTHIQVRVATTDRRCIYSHVHSLSSNQFALTETISQVVAEQVQIARDRAELEWGPLRLIGIAIPARVAERPEDQEATGQNVIYTRFTPPPGIDVLLENNVNCAALAEQLYGAAHGHANFAYVQIGLKIGMGLILSDRLIRGQRGGAGEVGHLAFPWAPGLVPKNGEIERYLGAEGLMRRVRSAWPASAGLPPANAEEFLALAEAGNQIALAQLQQHAEDIGALVASIASIVDPGLVVLGGGIGASRLLPDLVERAANRLSYQVHVRGTGLGRDATVLGIERLAVEAAVPRILGEI